jgi:hypothetical protein
MAKTFLQLAAALRQEVAGNGTGPSAVTGQTGELKRIVDWISAADEDVQQEHDEWKFMVGSFTLNTVADDNSYAAADCVTPITNLRDWRMRSFKIYLLSAGTSNETALQWISYQDWYERYNTGPQTSQRPVHFAVGNDMSIKLGPTPNAVYRISGEYQKSVTTLAANGDTPAYPSEYHMLPVYGGMMKYGRYTGASEVYQDGERQYNKLMRRMERTQLPRVRLAGPLA